MELEVINPEHEVHGKMLHNESHKHESIFTVTVQDKQISDVVSLAGKHIRSWVSHGEGKINLPMGEDKYNIVAKYGYEGYPANPTDFNTAMLDTTSRHLVMMHIERSTFQWNGHITQRIETMKFRLGMKPCECQKWIDKK
jgi:phosphoribosylformylglycinamidine synthase